MTTMSQEPELSKWECSAISYLNSMWTVIVLFEGGEHILFKSVYCKLHCNTKNVYKWIIHFISRKEINQNNIKCSIKIGKHRKERKEKNERNE